MERIRIYETDGSKIEGGRLELLCDNCGNHHDRVKMVANRDTVKVFCSLCAALWISARTIVQKDSEKIIVRKFRVSALTIKFLDRSIQAGSIAELFENLVAELKKSDLCLLDALAKSSAYLSDDPAYFRESIKVRDGLYQRKYISKSSLERFIRHMKKIDPKYSNVEVAIT